MVGGSRTRQRETDNAGKDTVWPMNVSANNSERYVVGVDFGTLSGRALVVRVGDGAEVGTAVHEYRHGVIDRELPSTGEPLPPDWALQDPEDYREVLRRAVPEAVAQAGVDPERIIGIGADFTACTVLATTADGTPLCEIDELRSRPHAYPKLWKHHAAQPQADRITDLAHARGELWIARYGGRISSEWEFAKGLQLLEEDPEIYQRAERWIEGTDWITWQLCGSETRNACTAGYKGIYQDRRYPSKDYLAALIPGFADFTAKLEHPIAPLGSRAGGLTAPGRVVDGPAGGNRGVRGECGRARHRARRAGGHARSDAACHGHLDVSRAQLRETRRGSRHVRCRRRRHHRRALGL